MTQNHYSQDRTKYLRITFTLFLTYITNFMFRPKMTLEFYDSIRIFSYKSQSQGGSHIIAKQTSTSKTKLSLQTSRHLPSTLPPSTQVHTTARFPVFISKKQPVP